MHATPNCPTHPNRPCFCALVTGVAQEVIDEAIDPAEPAMLTPEQLAADDCDRDTAPTEELIEPVAIVESPEADE